MTETSSRISPQKTVEKQENHRNPPENHRIPLFHHFPTKILINQVFGHRFPFEASIIALQKRAPQQKNVLTNGKQEENTKKNHQITFPLQKGTPKHSKFDRAVSFLSPQSFSPLAQEELAGNQPSRAHYEHIGPWRRV